MAFNKAKAMQEAEKLVSQRKIAEAIKQYSRILEKDPSDISLLNTIGDLQYRENNKAEALQNFNKLADAYMKDGFTVKAIAIYRKISKIDPNQVEPYLKLAELYILQGLSREARDQYAQAVDYYRRHNQPDRALETFRKIVALDPENRTFRARLAELAEQLGRKEEAGLAYLQMAEAAVRAGEVPAAETALKKVLEIDPKSEQAHLLRARLALSKREYGQVEKILDSVPALKDTPQGRRLLIEVYLETHRAESAEKLVLSAFQANPDDFSPLASFASLCAEKGNWDAALGPLQQAADKVIERKGAAPLMETLRHIWSKHPQHIPTLQLAVRVAEKTSDEVTLVEALSALGRAHEQAGELQEAEQIYQKLVGREPANEDYRSALQQVMEKQGKKAALPSPVLAEIDLSALGEEIAAAPAPPAEDTEQAAMVKEALDNSDLFSRYGLVDKAVAELEKILAVYPEQVEIHRRIFEVCHRTQPERATKAAEALAEIFRRHGDLESARKYEEVVGQVASGAEMALPVAAPVPAAEEAPEPAEAAAVEVDLTEVFPVTAPAEPAPEPPAGEPAEIPLELSAPVGAPAAPAVPEELDLSGDLEAFAAPAEPVAAPAAEIPAAAFNYREAREEIEFYLDQNLHDEARNAVQVLDERFPGDPQVAELRQYVEARTAPPQPAEVAPSEEAPLEAPVSPNAERAAPREVPVGPGPFELAPEITPEAVAPSPPEVMPAPPEPSPPAFGGPPPAPPSAPPPMEAPAAGGDLLGSLAGDLEAGLEGFGDLGAPAASPGAPAQSALARDAESPLSGLLEELGEGGAAQAAQDDPETHYNLGVAFREMGLLDEAIGEFQKVVKGAQKGSFPPNFLQACSLLAVSFMDKGMPAIAVKWYVRALEFPGLDEESTMSLQYDLGVAYEQAGDTRTALEKFSEVYSQNIDFRDVAEKIRTLQQKAR